ncbi:hypothetical protein BX616_009191 [Lobosporangium transversale]|nr:hypothetical protein BX616_009191 [Lobosporangium transversale]
MDDLLGLSWDNKGSTTTTTTTTTTSGVAGWSNNVKPSPPPPTVKPAHLQMGLNKTGLTPTPVTSASSYLNNNNTRGTNMGMGLSSSSASTTTSTTTSKKRADEVFESLMPSFGQNAASNISKSLDSMSLEERRRYDQQRQQFPSASSIGGPFNLGNHNSRSNSPAPSSSSLSSSSFSQSIRPAFTPPVNGASALVSTSAPRGNGSGSAAGPSKPIATASPQPAAQAFTSSIPKLQQPQPALPQQQTAFLGHQKPAGAGTGAGLMASPSGLAPKDPFGALLGDQISSRSSPSLKDQSLDSIRYNTPPPGQTVQSTKAIDPWDLDFLANATTSKPAQPAPASSNDIIDLGVFEKAPPEKTSPNRDSTDALNSFIGKKPSPVAPSPHTSPSASRKESPVKSPRSPLKSQSKEDEDIAQIVSMGFSVDRAKRALSIGGGDIEAAIEYLVQIDETESQSPSGTLKNRARERGHYRDDSDPSLDGRRRRNDSQSRQGHHGQASQRTQDLTRAQQLQQHKDKIIGQASVFGMSVLSKANEIYKQGRDKAQALIEEMTIEEPQSAATRRFEWIDDERGPGGYKDSDSEEDEVYRGRRQREQEQRRQKEQQQYQERTSRPRQEKETFEDTYVSSARKGGLSSSKNQKPLFPMGDSLNNLPSSSKSSTSGKPPSNRPLAIAHSPPPVPPKLSRPPRILVQASNQQMVESNRFKEKGNEAFKLGQFGQAAEFYAQASRALPSNHILLVVTQNNRAAALLKIGEYRETVSECDRSILLVQGPDGQGHLDALPPDTGVNLKDQLGKALMRRATAYENLEKYKEARDDWAKLRELDPGHRNAAEGHRRCEKALAVMAGGGEVPAQAPANKTVSSSSSASRSNVLGVTMSSKQDIFVVHQQSHSEARMKVDLGKSQGVSKLRQTAAQQEKEDDEKLKLRDQVDMKTTMWKSGKEDNVRALIASLGSVLWEGAGWKPVGMHELVTPQQVKIKYMRAIGKVHPDKLNSSTTVEQRMMANTIFSTLNSAWDAFKAQNNMQ